MLRRSMVTRERLDGVAVDIEFLLLAVIQGLALTTLAVDSEGVITELQWVYWPYMIAGFILIVNFWTLAITHSISFIAWPFDVIHTILYLLVTFVEVAAFGQITHPDKWFVFMLVFFTLSALLYAWDMRMIVNRQGEFQDSPARARLYAHIRSRQDFELRMVVPAAVVFQAAVVMTLWLRADLILAEGRHLYIVGAQIVFGLGYLASTILSFEKRKQLMTACIEEPVAA